MCNLNMARFGCWAFYVLDIIFFIFRMFYHWIVFGNDGQTHDLVDAIFFTLLTAGFWVLGFYSTTKRNYFGNISDWATDTEIRFMYFVCLPTGLLFRNCSSDTEIRDFAAPFELYFWKLYTIYNCTVSALTILVAFAQGMFFSAFFVAFLLGLYVWSYYTLTTHAKPETQVQMQIENANLSAEQQREIVYGHSQPAQDEEQPPAYVNAAEDPKIDFEPIQIKESENTAETGTKYDQQGLIAPTNA